MFVASLISKLRLRRSGSGGLQSVGRSFPENVCLFWVLVSRTYKDACSSCLFVCRFQRQQHVPDGSFGRPLDSNSKGCWFYPRWERYSPQLMIHCVPCWLVGCLQFASDPRRCTDTQSLRHGIWLRMKHMMCVIHVHLHRSAGHSDEDAETNSPWIQLCVFGPDTRVVMVTLCAKTT